MDKFIKIGFVFATLLFLIEGLVLDSASDFKSEFTLILEVQLFIIYSFWLIYFVSKKGLGNIFSLFLLCLGLFNFQKIFWGYFLGLDYRMADSLIMINLSEDAVQQTLFIYAVFTTVIAYSYFIFSKSIDRKIGGEVQEDVALFRLGRTVMLLFYGFACYRSYLEFTALFGKSYSELYTDEGSVDIPSYLRITAIIYQVGFMMILASKPKRKNFFIFSALFLIVLIPNLFTGLRATFAVSILVLFWYYINVYNLKVNLVKIALGSILLITILQQVALSRENRAGSDSVIELLVEFLYQQSQSMYVLSLYIQYEDAIAPNNYPFVLDPFVSWIFPSGQSVEVINSRSSLGHHLTYSLSSSYYLSGSSLGTNFIAELSEFGIIMVIFGGIVFAYFIAIFEKNVYSSRLLLFLSLIIVSYFFIAPRSSFFPNFYFIFRSLVFFYLFLLITKTNVKSYFRIKGG